MAVIRISGNDCLRVLEKLEIAVPTPRYAKFCKVKYNGQVIDEAVVLYFKAPHSFTGEDVLELQVHGSRAVIRTILTVLGGMENLRMAEPGEFSRRAFENGKMDLTEAEGLADLIEAGTEAQVKQAMRQMQGELGKIYDSWRAEMLSLLSHIEAYIDFPDEDLPKELADRVVAQINDFAAKILEHLNDNKRGERIREGLYITIIGAPNVGKSSLLNYLAKRDAAIVSDTAGTTRDVIEVSLEIGGYPVTIADTAGLRETSDNIESEGIKRAKAKAEQADFKIAMFESGKEQDSETFHMVDEDTVVLINKVDDEQRVEGVGIPISIKSGYGLEKMLQVLETKITEKYGLTESATITRARHRIALTNALNSLNQFSTDKPIELIAEDIRYAARSLGQITGKIDVDEILGEIFSKFCIGK